MRVCQSSCHATVNVTAAITNDQEITAKHSNHYNRCAECILTANTVHSLNCLLLVSFQHKTVTKLQYISVNS